MDLCIHQQTDILQETCNNFRHIFSNQYITPEQSMAYHQETLGQTFRPMSLSQPSSEQLNQHLTTLQQQQQEHTLNQSVIYQDDYPGYDQPPVWPQQQQLTQFSPQSTLRVHEEYQQQSSVPRTPSQSSTGSFRSESRPIGYYHPSQRRFFSPPGLQQEQRSSVAVVNAAILEAQIDDETYIKHILLASFVSLCCCHLLGLLAMWFAGKLLLCVAFRPVLHVHVCISACCIC